jgi:hypothetical protein
MTDAWFYRYLDLPTPPNWVIDYATGLLPDLQSAESTNNIQARRLEDPEVLNWIRENISKDHFNLTVTWTTFGRTSSSVHTDTGRKYGLMYVLDAGGSDVVTSFYHQRGKPLYRDYRTFTKIEYCDKVDEVKIEEKRWILLNAQVIHCVTNIERPRIALQFGYNDLDHIRTSFDKIG